MREPDFKALIVEDNPKLRQFMMRALARHDFRSDGAADGDEATRYLENNSYDVVVVDLCLPIKNGHKLASEVLLLPQRPAVVVVTAIHESRIEKDLIQRGVEGIFHKPISYQVVAEKITELVKQRRVAMETQVDGDYFVELTRANPQPDPKHGLPDTRYGESNEPETHAQPQAREAELSASSEVDYTSTMTATMLPSSAPMVADVQPSHSGTHHGEVRGVSATSAVRHAPAIHESSAEELQDAHSMALVVESYHAEDSHARTDGSHPDHTLRHSYGWPTWANPPVKPAGTQTALFAICFVSLMSLQIYSLFFHHQQKDDKTREIESLGANVSHTDEEGTTIKLNRKGAEILLKVVMEVPDLRQLELKDSDIQDRDLPLLEGMRELRQLNLDNTSITDKGIQQFPSLPALRELSLRNTEVSNDEVKELQRRNPKLNVIRNP